jgi:hypothetical protein
MNVIQEAQMYQDLLTSGVTKAAIMENYQIAQGTLNSRLAWLELPAGVQQLVASGKLSSNIRVAKAIGRLPEKIQVVKTRQFAHRGLGIEEIEQEIAQHVDSLLLKRVEGQERLSDGRLFIPVELAVNGLNGSRRRNLTEEAISAARNVCELCSLQSTPEVCRPCPLVTMLVVLMRREQP